MNLYEYIYTFSAVFVFFVLFIPALAPNKDLVDRLNQATVKHAAKRKMTYGERIIFPTVSPHRTPPPRRYPKPRKISRFQSKRDFNEGRGFPSAKGRDEEKRRRLATIMKAKYREFRKNLEDSKDVPKQPPPSLPQTLNTRPNSQSYYSPRETWEEKGSPLAYPFLSLTKKLRSADEAPSFSRSAGIRPEAQPFIQVIGSSSSAPSSWPSNSSQIQLAPTMKVSQNPENKLSTSVPLSFDPSIVVDFYSLLHLTRRSQRLEENSPSSSRIVNKNVHPKPVLINTKSSEEVRVIRRRLTPQPVRAFPRNDSTSTPESAREHHPSPNFEISKRAQYLQRPSSVAEPTINAQELPEEELSVYILKDQQPVDENGDEDELEQTDEEQEDAGGGSEFGPHSQGNDPNAGLDPTKITIPRLDLSQLPLPQGVKDSLKKYLRPLISTLKPLRKSVPGLPGLDYPILSVVPYTNFYCSNMPWPGFYADTEARCQTWHACDVDGRQSTFLCPNGTIFNQALMVCDWWYNTDCLAAPFLYPLNERLFGTLKPEPVTPHTRITPELLDTIFT